MSVDLYVFRSPVSARFDMTFARLRTAEVGVVSDFLVCPGLRLSNLLGGERRRVAFVADLETLVAARGWQATARARGA